MKRIVLVPAVAAVLKLEIVNELPPVFNPLMLTLLAPLRLINGALATVPDIVLAPVGLTVSVVQPPWVKRLLPVLRTAVRSSKLEVGEEFRFSIFEFRFNRKQKSAIIGLLPKEAGRWKREVRSWGPKTES